MYSEHTMRNIEDILTKAELAFKINSTSNFSIRVKRLENLRNTLQKNLNDCATLITMEMGKPITQTTGELKKCITLCDYYIENSERFLKNNTLNFSNKKAIVSYQPIGTVLAIMPWNFPFWQVLRCAIPAIMAGNTVVLKHAPNVPQCASKIENLFKEALFPEGVFQNVFLDTSKVKILIKDHRINGVALTGSVQAGAKVGSLASKNIKKSVLELGGNDAFIVLADANLGEAAKAAVQSRMVNAGQTCISSKRWVVEERIYDAFLGLVKKEMEQVKLGDPMDKNTTMGPLARPDLVKSLKKQVLKSLDGGATLEMGGLPVEESSNFYQPTLLTDVVVGNVAFKEELFGPVACIVTAKNDVDAVEIANNSSFGLGAAIWTTNVEKGLKIAQKLQVGNVALNDIVKSYPELPFGGVKNSGYGRELGEMGIKEFTNVKGVVFS